MVAASAPDEMNGLRSNWRGGRQNTYCGLSLALLLGMNLFGRAPPRHPSPAPYPAVLVTPGKVTLLRFITKRRTQPGRLEYCMSITIVLHCCPSQLYDRVWDCAVPVYPVSTDIAIENGLRNLL